MHEEGCDRCRSNESFGHPLTELAVPACKSGEYNPPPSVPHMDGKRAAPRKGRRVVFLGGYAPVGRDPCVPPPGTHFSAGHAGPALRDGMLNRVSGTASRQRGGAALLGPLWEGAVGAADWGREKRVASLPPSALRADTSLSEGGEGRRIPTPVCGLARNDSASRCLGGRSRSPLQVFIGDSRAGCRTPRGFVPLRATAGRRPRRFLRGKTGMLTRQGRRTGRPDSGGRNPGGRRRERRSPPVRRTGTASRRRWDPPPPAR